MTFTIKDIQQAFDGEFFSEAEINSVTGDPKTFAPIAKKAFARLQADERKRQWRGLSGQWVLFHHSSGVWFWLRLGDGVAHSIIKSSAAKDDRATQFLLKRLTAGGTFLDIGANAGWFTLRAANRYRELGKGRVISFEPQADHHQHLLMSLQQNKLEGFAEVHNVAIGDRTEQVWITDAGMNSGGTYVSWSKPTRVGGTIDMRRFDDMFPDMGPVDCIKLDIEGSEPLFFRGAEVFIRKHKPLIYCEIGDRKLQIVSKITGENFVAEVEALGYRTHVLTSAGTLTRIDRQEVAKHSAGILNVVFEHQNKGDSR